jgi:hypothetical protein
MMVACFRGLTRGLGRAPLRQDSDLPRTHAMLVGVAKEQVEIARHMSEHSQQQRHLATVMNPMIGPVLHQFPQCH